MTSQSIMQIIINDLDSMILRIGSLARHSELDKACEDVRQAKNAVIAACDDIYQRSLNGEFGP